MNSTEQMVRINHKQAEFYDAIHEAGSSVGREAYDKNNAANLLTRLWAELRYRQQSAGQEAGVVAFEEDAHRRWIRTKAGGDFLEIGCFSGSRLTFDLVRQGKSYLGVELSGKAVAALNATFREKGVASKARAVVGDFLLLPERKEFDLIYSHGVLHHFEDADVLFRKLALMTKPGGLLVFSEPSAIHPVYRVLRALYRPFQSDAKWEWPFTTSTVKCLNKYYEVIEGFGWGGWSLPLSVLTGMPALGRVIKPLYIRRVRAEIARGWNDAVWWNSYVAAVCCLRGNEDSSMTSNV